MVNTQLTGVDMPILAQPPDITETDKAVLRDVLGLPDRDPAAAKPRGAEAMRAAAREAVQKSRKHPDRRYRFQSRPYGSADLLPGEHADQFCRYPG